MTCVAPQGTQASGVEFMPYMEASAAILQLIVGHNAQDSEQKTN
jgi:hypothetical protein